ncbi:MAG: glycosyltransferase 87 family protein [Fimbriimonadaceae bacterium]|nr:glycosyltransferase 87 family protein [Alphaproteobacteria bacterium]
MIVFTNALRDPVRFRKMAIGLALLIAAVEFYYAVFLRVGDFEVHRVFGRNFIDRAPYLNANVYLLPRLMFDAVPALMNYYAGRAIFYLAAIGGLVYCIHSWAQMAQARFPLPPAEVFKANVIAVAILSPLLLRDLDECGLQILLLVLLTLAARSFLAGKKTRSGFYLALAIAYKSTPLLFLPFLLWKRQWHVSAALTGWLVVVAVLPAAWLGWDETLAAYAKWWHQMQDVLQTSEAYPSLGSLEPPKQQNLGLRALIARFIETYPDGHPLNLGHPLFVQFGDLGPETAKRVVYGIVLLLGAAIAWRFRRPWPRSESRGGFVVEWAVACLFVGLLSPAAWMQHLIVGFPVVLLAVRAAFVLPRSFFRIAGVVLIAALILLTKQFLVGGDLKLVLLSYKPDTFALLLAAALAVFAPHRKDAP